MVEFLPIASSSAGNAYVLKMDGGSLLLDCGVSIDAIQKATNFLVSKLCGCLITHAHTDHCKSARDLMRLGVKCYATDDAWNEIARGFPLAGLSHKVVTPREPFYVGPWMVTAFEVLHDSPGTVGYVLDQPDQLCRCVYLTDSAYSKFTFEGMTHLFVECNHSTELMRQSVERGMDTSRYSRTASNHMSIERLIRFLEANDTSKLQEIHLLHLSDANSDEAAFRKQIQEVIGCPVYVAKK